MTDRAVELSITIKVNREVVDYQREIRIEEIETGVSQVVQEIGLKVLMAGLKGLDDEIRKEVPEGWRNVGTERRSILSSVGRVRYRRRVYKDENGIRRKPVDEVMGAYLASEGTYRRAASQMSWLMKTKISHSSIQKMVWQVGNRIADGEEAERRRVFEAGEAIPKGKVKAEVLYG